MKFEELRLGLDVGSNSVGWALLNEKNELVKKNGFTFWGVRMFDEASPAVDRRNFRNGRRRYNRRKQRILWLQELFQEEINKVDPTFFQRLEDSFYKQEDKQNANYYNLFVDGYTDKDYFSQYPTIYHLRKHLIFNDEKVDIRQFYLAIHNIIKYRGNFLVSGDEFKQSDYSAIKENFIQLNNIILELKKSFEEDEAYQEEYFTIIHPEQLDDTFFLSLKGILISKESIRDKKIKLLELFQLPTKSIINEAVIPFLAGTEKINFSSLSIIKERKYEKLEIEIASENLLDKINEGKQLIPDFADFLDFYVHVKEIIDFHFVIKLLNKYKYYSEAMVGIYDEHQEDLKKLKKFIKQFDPNDYNLVFRSVMNNKNKSKDKENKKVSLNNYPSYIGMNNVNKKTERFKHCSRSDFYSFLKKIFEKIQDPEAQEQIKYFESKMENNSFLLRQNSDQNGSFPMQLHLQELKEILHKQSKYYPFLNEQSDGIKVSDKIISIFKYKLPYFVGPLNQNSPFSWVERTNEKIYPWNYEQVINFDETAIKFITRMQNKCTYLKGDDDFCLPKKSILFSTYNCLSYLNKININGAIISPEIKKQIFEEVFLKIKKPTKKDILQYLISNYGFDATTTNGKTLPDVNCDMSAYIIFKDIFGEEFEKNKDMIENIIRDITIFEDKSILERRLYRVYNLNKERAKQIKNLNFKDYSSLSKRLLNGLPITNQNTGEIEGNLIDVMWRTNMNLQEILYSPDYKFIDTINTYNKKLLSNIEYNLDDFIEENIYVSPIMKRSMIQAIKVIEDIEKAIGQKINRYYIECTRSNQQKKGPTNSRYKALKEKYKKCKDLAVEFNIDLNKLDKKLDECATKDSLKSDLVYLYFSQLGKCMYTLENIDFDDLIYGNNKYDIDHIYPQSLIKDDSLSNRVLTNKQKNANKSDNMISEIEGFLPKNAYAFYEKLMEVDLISAEKYRQLTKKEFAVDELNGFVNRQIVATNQSVKGLIEVLIQYKKVDPSNIVYSKAENVSDFRKTFDLVKSRLANNFHHAHDAYLNVIVGGTLHDYYQSKKYYYFKDYQRIKNDGFSLNPNRILKQNTILINDKEIWNKNEIIKQIKYDLYERYDVHETKRTFCKNDMISKVTIVPAKEVKNNVPIKTTTPRKDIKKYGGITSYSYSKFVIIKTINKLKEDIYQLIPIPRPFVNHENTYLQNLGFKDFEITIPEVKINTLVEFKALKYVITGVSNNRFVLQNARDRYFDYPSMKTIKKIEKYYDNKKLNNKMDVQENYIILAYPKNNDCQEIRLNKEEVVKLLLNIKKIYSREIYDFSIIHQAVLKIDDSLLNLSIVDLITLTYELLRLLQTNSRQTANLKLLDESENAGTFLLSKNLEKGMRFIVESPCGYYKKVLFEVK